MRFVVADEGPGFDPNHVPHAATEDDPVAHMEIREQLGLRDGGFGIMIAKGMVDGSNTTTPATRSRSSGPCPGRGDRQWGVRRR